MYNTSMINERETQYDESIRKYVQNTYRFKETNIKKGMSVYL